MNTALWFAAVVAVVALLARLVLYPSFDPKQAKGKRVVVTGASMGIGEQVAYELSKMGAHVVIIARSKEKMERIVSKCKDLGAPSASYISTDLSTKDENILKATVDEAAAKLGGGIDMLILNHLTPGEEHNVKLWPQTFEQRGLPWLVNNFYTNVFSYFVMSNHALPMLERNNGKLVVVSSLTGMVGVPITVGYSAQKHALHGYFNALRSNLASQNRYNTTITVCVLGAIGTEKMMKNVHKINLTPAPIDGCAKSIIGSGFLGDRIMYYPYSMLRPSIIIYTFWPELLELMMQKFAVES